jgi:hypothetical protein
METVTPGKQVSFSVKFTDDNGALYDPDSAFFYIVRFVNQILHGPISLDDEYVERVSTGSYIYNFIVSDFIQPAVYTLKTMVIQDDVPSFQYQYFEVIEPQIEKSGLLDPPRKYGKIKEIFDYGNMGRGLTDTICLIGHCDGLTINEPVRVTNMKEVVRMMQADPDSPLLRGLLEAYNSGAQDIVLVAAAPMIEYMPSIEDRQTPMEEWGGKNFYENYYDRLEDTYTLLKEYDDYEIVVPLEAPFYDSGEVDFLTQLADFCESRFALVSQPAIGIIGTRTVDLNSQDVDAMVADERLLELDVNGDSVFKSKGKFVVIAVGEGSFYHPQLTFSCTSSVAVAVAARMAILDYASSVTYKKLTQIVSLANKDLTKDQIKALSSNRLNAAIRTTAGKRSRVTGGTEIVLATDNTLSPEGSDYWSVATLRIVSKVIKQIKLLGSRRIGTLGYAQLQKEIDNFLRYLTENRYLRDYDFNMYKSPFDMNAAVVEVSLTPYFQVREVTFQTTVGPSE